MAKPYQEGKGWAIRLRYKRQQIYLSGFSSEAAAVKAAKEKQRALDSVGKPKGHGPWRTSVGQAMQDYARERLPFLKGADQESRRINRYLRLLGLDLVRVRKPDPAAGNGCHWVVELIPCPTTRSVPTSLQKHRSRQAGRTMGSDAQRALLARTMMADVTRYQVQDLVSALEREGLGPATIALERSLLRVLFNHASNIWSWPEPMHNPATSLKMPEVDNERCRVLTNEEWRRILEALQHAKKRRYVIPALALLLDTTMRSSELLLTACWQDIDMDRCILKLGTAKAGAREVPLSPNAMAVLRLLREKAGTVDPAALILPITYETLKAAWIKACKLAGIEDARIHDLRHTGATRYALEYHGNIFVLRLITGHRTDSQLKRYVNLKASDVVDMMHGRPLSEANAPAGLSSEKLAALFEPAPPPDNVISLDTAKRRAA